MGQSSAVSETPKLAEAEAEAGDEDEKASSSSALRSGFAQEYFSRYEGSLPSRYEGSSPRKSGRGKPGRSLVLEERTKAAMSAGCCHMPVVGFGSIADRSIVNASSGKAIGTDLQSLLDVDGDGKVDCGEVWRAICMNNPTMTDGQITTEEGAGYLNISGIRADDDSPALEPSDLQVPSQFSEVSYDWTAPSANQPAPSQSDQEMLQECMKPFLKSMLVGVLVRLQLDSVEAPEGDDSISSIDATLTLSEDLTVVTISAGSAQRPVPIKAVRLVRPADRGGESDKNVELLLSGDRFVCFNFDTEDQAKFFGTCMRLLVKASRSNMASPLAEPVRRSV